ncbi:acyl-CoA synthetase family member 2, mitochondrial [Trichonephila clavipes]|nr:acyl-CoA synthetase family member 2, mitochondrial [Trichonephila clavipes]
MLFEECLEDISLKSYNEMHVRCKMMSEDENFNKKNYIKHFVQPGDTLQGLALQYGVNNYHTHLEEEYENYRKPPDGADTFQCNNRIVMAQRKHLDDFLRGRIIGRLECGRTQLEVSEELGIAHSVISRLWQRFQDDGHIGLYARRPVRCVPLTATHCRLRLTWSREHALWTPQQWTCVMFSDESRFSLQSDSRRNLIWKAPGTRYHQENTIERHCYGGARWLARLGRNYSWFLN